MNEVKGFLMIDQRMNTVIIPWDSEELIDALRRYKLHDSIKPHSGLKMLDLDVRAYLKGNYVSGRRNHPEL